MRSVVILPLGLLTFVFAEPEGQGAEIFDSPGPGYREQWQRFQPPVRIRVGPLRVVKPVGFDNVGKLFPNPSAGFFNHSFRSDGFFAPSLEADTIDAFSHPIRLWNAAPAETVIKTGSGTINLPKTIGR